MKWPLIILAVPTVMIGWPLLLVPVPGFRGTTSVLEQMLEYGEPIVGSIDHEMLLGALAGDGGLDPDRHRSASAWAFSTTPPAWHPRHPPPRRRFDASRPASRFSGVHNFLVHKWYFDELYNAVFVRPTLALARAASQFDKWVIDGIVNGSARVTELLSRAEGVFDQIAVDGLVNWTARGVYFVGDWGRDPDRPAPQLPHVSRDGPGRAVGGRLCLDSLRAAF